MDRAGQPDGRPRAPVDGVDVRRAIAVALPDLAKSDTGPDRIAYARDLWPRHHLEVAAGRVAEHRPALVVWPNDTAEVAAVVRFCAAEGVPLVPFGAGSGVCGAVLPDPRTVVLDLKRLERWRRFDPAVPSLEVEAGALGIRLEEDLQAKGFTAGHFPSSILCSTAGGWVAARGAGQCSGRYGKIEDMVASLECVVGRGEVVRFHRRTHGPDLTPLFIGSEGVLGVITSVDLRLHPAPPARAFGAFSFPTVEAGWTAMRDMFQAGLRPAVARLYDPFDSYIARRGSVRRARSGAADEEKHGPKMPGAGGLALRSILRVPRVLNEAVEALGGRLFRGSTLVLIFEGPPAEGAADMERARGIASRHGAEPLGEGPARHWLEHRYGVSYRQSPVFMSGAFSDTMEVAAPWSRLAGLYRDVRAALGRHVFVMAHLSHAYPDGCSIYFTFAGSAATPEAAIARYDATWRAALDAAIAAGGTLSHHHGVGRSKAPKLGAELGLGVDVVHALRGVFDPAGIMNPGNLLPRERPARRPVSLAPATPAVDRDAQLVHARGEATLAEVERALGAAGLTLGLDAGAPPLAETTVAAWIAAGAHGAPDPWLDPVDHLVAGFTSRLASGAELEVRPSPRRAVGPDLFALQLGGGERAGVLTSAHLRGRSLPGSRPSPTDIPRDPPADEVETAWIDRALEAAGAVS
jgi:alkyldihydroxyacetonephosphate synthase